MGDLAAFDLVRAHFRVLHEIVAGEAGAIVKTMGDAVMATFPEPDRAVAAALRMRDEMRRLTAERGREDEDFELSKHAGVPTFIDSAFTGILDAQPLGPPRRPGTRLTSLLSLKSLVYINLGSKQAHVASEPDVPEPTGKARVAILGVCLTIKPGLTRATRRLRSVDAAPARR